MMKNAFAPSTFALASTGTASIRPLILFRADISARGFLVINRAATVCGKFTVP